MSAPTPQKIDLSAIEKQAKAIMDAFLKELGDVKQEAKFGLQREREMREPKACETDPQFRQAFFANAPKVKDDELVMERKQW